MAKRSLIDRLNDLGGGDGGDQAVQIARQAVKFIGRQEQALVNLSQEVKRLRHAVAGFYLAGEITKGEAVHALRISREEFQALLPKGTIDVHDDPMGDRHTRANL